MNPAPRIDAVVYDESTPLLDHEQVDMLAACGDGTASMLKRWFDLFVSESLDELEALEAVCDRSDLIGFRRIIHFVAGGAGNLGLARLAAFYRGIEQALDAERLTDLSECAGAVLEEFELGREVYEAELNAIMI